MTLEEIIRDDELAERVIRCTDIDCTDICSTCRGHGRRGSVESYRDAVLQRWETHEAKRLETRYAGQPNGLQPRPEETNLGDGM